MASRELLRFTEVAQALGCSVGNIYALKEAGLIHVISTGAKGKGFRIRASELERFLQRSDTGSAATAPTAEVVERSALRPNVSSTDQS